MLDTTSYSYAEVVGSLLYLSVCTRPDIAQAVGAQARHVSKPTMRHWLALKGVLRYLAGTQDYGLVFTGSKSSLEVYCDADYAGDPDTRRSTTGYVFIMYGGVVSWSSRLQPSVALSTAEAEYMAAATATKEALWLRILLKDQECQDETVNIKCDNQGAIQLGKNPIASQRSKHIDVRYHFVREHVQSGDVIFKYCATQEMVADILTKPLPRAKFVFCREKMGVMKL